MPLNDLVAFKCVSPAPAVVVVPPSEKPTTVRIYRRPKAITKQAKEMITGDKGSPDYSVTSDRRDVTATTGRDIGLWPYLAGALGVLALLAAARRWWQRLGWFGRIVKRLFPGWWG